MLGHSQKPAAIKEEPLSTEDID